MLSTPEIVSTPEILTASIRLNVPGPEMPLHMGPAIGELFRTLQEMGVQATGPLFSYHHQMPSEMFDFEVGVPVDHPFEGKGRVEPSTIPPSMVLRVTYTGPYEGLAEAWMATQELLEAAGHPGTETFWESYVVGPAQTEDSTLFQTELNWVLAS